ncbi:MAG: cyclophilin-like fold protein [Bacteroides sp.]|nr:cyclophilin-like fold protein [Roseburia sp.]MCM1347402.1 cyclophilin-like fold protein [Bacteroides sp.]MCM1421885.1 cyclophilin-like fold protein [Bacteroides sp.]
MMDLYSHKMCYRFSEALPTDDVNTCGYEVSWIVYYPPIHGFVIMYAQNGEHFSMQKLGRIDSGVEIFRNTGNTDVTFEIVRLHIIIGIS